MNVTLAMPEALVEQARALAAKRGTTLNQMIRDLLERETGGPTPGEQAARELEELWKASLFSSNGQRYPSRDELYAERIK